MNIYEKMSKVTETIERVAKNLNVSTGKSSYKAVSEGNVLASVKPAEIENKIYSYPAKREIVYQKEIESQGTNGTKINMFMRVKTIYRFVNIEKPEEFVDVETFGDGWDTQDKASGKAMTYADKYALLKAYKIETGDDPDQYGSQDIIEPKVSKGQIEQMTALGIDLQKCAVAYGKKTINELSIKEANQAIELKSKQVEMNTHSFNGDEK